MAEMEAAVNSLPDKILEIIFSYCSHSDLVQSIPNVCCRWREVAQSTTVWKDVTYCPQYFTRYEEVLEMLEISPKLQNIILRYNYDDRVLQVITDNCVGLRKLEISESQVIHMNIIKNLQEKCPKIEYLNMPSPALTPLDKCEVGLKFTNLKILQLTGCEEISFSLILKPVADYCKKLEHLKLCNGKFEMNDLCYLLSMRKDTLHTLGVCCRNQFGECVLPALSTCQLKSLSLFRYCDCRRPYKKLEHFGRLKTVKALSITSFNSEDDLKQIFENENMAQLVELSLGGSPNFDNDVAEVIVRNCPLVKHLSLKRMYYITDATLKIMSNLKELISLTISEALCVADTWILHLQGVKGLKRLTISLSLVCLQDITELSTLQALTLEWQNLADFPWDLIPHRMQSLQYLHLHGCTNVDLCDIQKLKIQLPRLKVFLNIVPRRTSSLLSFVASRFIHRALNYT